MVCAAKGYKCIIVMPQLPPMAERYLICRKFGAHVHLTAALQGEEEWATAAEAWDRAFLEDPPVAFHCCGDSELCTQDLSEGVCGHFWEWNVKRTPAQLPRGDGCGPVG